MTALRINGSTKMAGSPKGGLTIGYREAIRLLLAAEAASEFPDFVREELPAIISHWLQSPEDPPILLDASYVEKWVTILRSFLQLRNHNPASGEIRVTKHAKPVNVDFDGLPFQPSLKKPKFTFLDLFAGIGGFRIGLESLGGKCVFSSEWDRHAKETYFQNYGEVPFGDIQRLSSHRLVSTEVDVVAGGFPCQPFSRAGVSARTSLGLNHGFECQTQGQLFYDVVNVAKIHRPKMLILENVGNIEKHDGGNTLEEIKRSIKEDLNYSFTYKIYNSNTLVPQSRVRCIIVAFRDREAKENWEMPSLEGAPKPLRSILENIPWDSKYTLSDAMWEGHQRRSKRNVERGTGFTAYPKDLDKPATTLVARYYKDGKECLIPQASHPRLVPRMLTERECARLQGFPEEFKTHPSKLHAYKQFGNAVPVPLVSEVAKYALNEI